MFVVGMVWTMDGMLTHADRGPDEPNQRGREGESLALEQWTDALRGELRQAATDDLRDGELVRLHDIRVTADLV